MTKKANIRDVAKAAGVSITAVSQIMNGLNRYSDETVKKVWDAVNELKYTPNPYAKKIFSRDTSRVSTGLLLRITYHSHAARRFQPTDHEAIRMFYFERSCMCHDHFGSNYVFRHGLELRNRLLFNDNLDGVILGLPHADLIRQISARMPAVLTDIEVDPEAVGIPVINTDFVQGFTTVLKRIQAAGIPLKMAVITGTNDEIADSVVTPESLAADFVYAAMHTDTELKKEHLINYAISNDTNKEVMKKIVKKVVQLVKNEGIRIVGIRNIDIPEKLAAGLEEAGLRLPEDVILLTSCDLPIRRRGVAAVSYDWEKMMEIAVDVLLQKIEGDSSVPGKYLVPCGEIETDFLDKK